MTVPPSRSYEGDTGFYTAGVLHIYFSLEFSFSLHKYFPIFFWKIIFCRAKTNLNNEDHENFEKNSGGGGKSSKITF